MTVKPRNTVAVAGSKVVLRCASGQSGGYGGNAITWTFGTRNPTCHRQRDKCNLVIERVTTSDAGAYECADGSGKIAQASLVVIGIASIPSLRRL